MMAEGARAGPTQVGSQWVDFLLRSLYCKLLGHTEMLSVDNDEI